jgi:hypothetical protein
VQSGETGEPRYPDPDEASVRDERTVEGYIN